MIYRKFLIVFGTRPEALKMIPLVKELNKTSGFQTKVCVTAQHRDMLDQVLETFDIKPDFDLNLMSKNQTLSDLTSKMLLQINPVLNSYKPDLVFVHGDTTTTFVVSLSCFYNRIDVAHVEAGLRTYNIFSPWPEEFNRQVTSKTSRFHFAPTDISKNNLLKEDISKNKILVTGNTIIDTLFLALDVIKNKNLDLVFRNNFPFEFLKKIVLITAHRRENFGEGISNICDSILYLSKKYREINFVYPVHLNPNIKEIVLKKLSNLNNVYLIEPLDYLQFIFLMKESYVILTDSGGVQEEAPSLNKPVLVMRETTERPEAVKYGKVKLVGTRKDKIIDEVSKLIDNSDYYETFLKNANPYGNGTAAKQIVKFLISKKCTKIE